MMKRQQSRAYLIIGSLAGILLLLSAVASAEQKQIDFSGVITRVDEGTTLDGYVIPGTVFFGSYTYDDTALDIVPDSDYWNIYEFEIPIFSYELKIGDVSVSAIEKYSIGLKDIGHAHGYSVSSSNIAIVCGETTDQWEHLSVALGDSSGSALDSRELTEVIDFDEWDSSGFVMFPYPYGPLVEGEITSFEYVPEPASLALLTIGGLAVVRRR